ncbi:uncharacterized protein C8orf59 homolog isoform X1 [Acanthaster planci]|uniref:Uncharacterized protein C8orf59 homolog isoform X1 n=1 Tax=Acanthaster planci TaxID=133434 RepID=A0A8B7YKT3_ACAPL|nr:uncharacterized protein C8orf59 homolog isoform X1 [Acanthaster planci]XP_022092136.1 uncharacterized protein C8orf59 homolog isoform X1 [Acanthaster planci]
MGKTKKQRSQLVKVKGTSEKQSTNHRTFKVSQHKATKAKHKAKVVSTNLKRLNFQNRQQVCNINDRFRDIQQSTVTISQPKATTPTLLKQVGKSSRSRPPNMEEATRQMAML